MDFRIDICAKMNRRLVTLVASPGKCNPAKKIAAMMFVISCGYGAPRRQWQLGESTKHTMAASGSSVKAQHHKHKLSSCTGSSVKAPITPQTQAKLITYRSTSNFCGHPQEADTSTQQGLSFLLLLPLLSQPLFAMR